MSAGGSGRTPGAWYAVKDRWRWTVSARDPFGDGEDCWLADVGSGVERAAVDARLMAAAPTMAEYIRRHAEAGDEEAQRILESLHASREHADCRADRYVGPTQPAALAAARAALAKAEGREPQR